MISFGNSTGEHILTNDIQIYEMNLYVFLFKIFFIKLLRIAYVHKQKTTISYTWLNVYIIQHYCESVGASLAVIYDAEEEKFLDTFLKQHRKDTIANRLSFFQSIALFIIHDL